MKYFNELKFILVSIFVINETNGNKDRDIASLLDYAFRRLYDTNTNLFSLVCLGKSKEQIMPEIEKLLNHTEYKKYLEEQK